MLQAGRLGATVGSKCCTEDQTLQLLDSVRAQAPKVNYTSTNDSQRFGSTILIKSVLKSCKYDLNYSEALNNPRPPSRYHMLYASSVPISTNIYMYPSPQSNGRQQSTSRWVLPSTRLLRHACHINCRQLGDAKRKSSTDAEQGPSHATRMGSSNCKGQELFC